MLYTEDLQHNQLIAGTLRIVTFLYPILGGDSPDKARNIWCAKDNGAVWRDWTSIKNAAW